MLQPRSVPVVTRGSFPYNESMIRSIRLSPALGKSLDDLQPALELFRALGFAPGNEWHEGGSHGIEMLAPSGGIEFIAAPGAPPVDATVEVSDADAAYEIVKKIVPTPSPQSGDKDGAPIVKIRREIHDTPYGARLFDVEVSGLRIWLPDVCEEARRNGLEGKLDGAGQALRSGREPLQLLHHRAAAGGRGAGTPTMWDKRIRYSDRSCARRLRDPFRRAAARRDQAV
jgi:hypothetical protein